MYNSRATLPTRFPISIFSINTVAGKNHKKPHHPFKVQGMNCFTANACGRRLPLLFITLQELHFVPPPSVTFRSLSATSLGNPRKSASTHSIALRPPLRFIPLPFGFPIPHLETQSQNGKLHSTQPNSLLSIQSPPLLFPTQSAVCPAVEFTPENQRLKIPRHPLMVQVK